eukprot:TRINITY_DN42171_c0_g1_i1.p1 TRINITY_DN42171_c0_g1~~TRINITY_DN42171_c0_g1_i1.p1  ORF type:complete len:250 (+),score=41.26 TRINITY_DN42171_c0_g1_i1:50-799(+)
MPLNEEAVGGAIGYVAMALTGVYFLSPMPTCLNIVRSRSVQKFSPVPYVVGVFNCCLWCYYCTITIAAIDENLIPNLVVNACGVGVFAIYVAIFLRFSLERRRLYSYIAVALGLLLLLVSFFEFVVPKFAWNFHWGGSKMPLKSSICGVVTDVINVLLYGSPLVVLRMVVRTKSVKYMPLSLSVLTLIITVLWLAQGLLIGNITVALPNLLGVILGVVQLTLYAIYCRYDCPEQLVEEDRCANEALRAS